MEDLCLPSVLTLLSFLLKEFLLESLLLFWICDELGHSNLIFLDDSGLEHLLDDEVVFSHLLLLLGHLGLLGLQSLNLREPSWLRLSELPQLSDGIGHFFGFLRFLTLLLFDRFLGPTSLCTRFHEVGGIALGDYRQKNMDLMSSM